MSKIKKIAFAVAGALTSALPCLAAEGDIDLGAVTTASGKIQTALTTFFTDTLGPLVTAVGGVSLGVYLVLAIFRWARKLGK